MLATLASKIHNIVRAADPIGVGDRVVLHVHIRQQNEKMRDARWLNDQRVTDSLRDIAS
jgi:hypothetical protein